MPKPTRAQDAQLEHLARRHDQLRCTPLGDGSLRVTGLDRRANQASLLGALRVTESYILTPHGTLESPRW